MKRSLGRITGAQAREALAMAGRIDRIVKGIAGGDVWNEFLRLALLLASAKKA